MLVATPGRLYVFLGGPGLQGAFSGYSSRSLGAQSYSQSVQRTNDTKVKAVLQQAISADGRMLVCFCSLLRMF